MHGSRVNSKRLSREIVAEAAAFKKQKSTGNNGDSENGTSLTRKAEGHLSLGDGKISHSTSSTGHGQFSGFAALVKGGIMHSRQPETSAKLFQRPTPKLVTTRDYPTRTKASL